VGGVKARYLQQDIERMATALGHEVCWPNPFDTDWIRPHAAFLYGLDQGAGPALGARLFDQRWLAGRDLGGDDVLEDAASGVGLEPGAVVAAADDPALQERVRTARAGTRRDFVFGVPSFIYKGALFWGNDRIDWLLRAVLSDLGHGVPDLSADPLARVY
jgi:2-hydroxychromene-2-carboxylate isomerase